MRHPWGMAEECARMAKVYFLYLLGVYLFPNWGQMVTLMWLALFRDFERARTANWRHECLAYFYSSLDTLSQGTLHPLVGPWKLLEVVSFPFLSQLIQKFSVNYLIPFLIITSKWLFVIFYFMTCLPLKKVIAIRLINIYDMFLNIWLENAPFFFR